MIKKVGKVESAVGGIFFMCKELLDAGEKQTIQRNIRTVCSL